MKVSEEIQPAPGETPQAPPERKKMPGEVKLFLGILIGAIVLGGLAIEPMLVHGPKLPEYHPPPPTPSKMTKKDLVPPGSHIRGNPNAPFSLVVFSDLQCPHCRDAEKKLPDLLEMHKDKLNIVYRHLRLSPNHNSSQTLAQAAEAAGMQGKFFEMADKIFEQQDMFTAANPLDVKNHMIDLAGAMGLNVSKFKADMDSKTALDHWQKDNEKGIDLGIVGTPMFYFCPPVGNAEALSKQGDLFDWVSDPKHWQVAGSASRAPGKS